MNEAEFRSGRASDDCAAKRAAQNICDNRRMSMPTQDFVGRTREAINNPTMQAQASELEHQISELEVSANRLEQILEITAKRLDPVIAKYPSDGTEGAVDPRPTRHSYVGHRLQQVQVRLDNLSAAVAALNDRLVV